MTFSATAFVLHPLTPRELEVAERLAAGKRNREIADELGCSVKTIDTHRWHILRKLHVRNNVELVLALLREGALVP